jgi:histidinol-phosphate phosphatase family protein
MRQAVLLAGGAGTRLKDRLDGRPKPLVDIDGQPLLARQLSLLREFGIGHVVLLVNHAADQIQGYCAANQNFGLEIDFIDDGEPRGTAGAVLAALDALADDFFVLYGDTLLNVNLELMWQFHQASGADATLFLHPNNHPHDSDLVETDQDDWITAFHPYPHPPGSLFPNLVNAGLYVISRAALEPWRGFETPSDLAKHLFPAMIANSHRLNGYLSFEYIKDIGTPARLDEALMQLRSGVVARASLSRTQKAVYVDRDGTLNRNRGYVRTPDEMELFASVPAAVHRLNGAEYRVVVVTNQPVVARGECTLDQLQRIHSKMEMLLSERGAYVDRILSCPHHPDRGFPGEIPSLKIVCECRKPATALIRRAAKMLNIDNTHAWLIGDSTADILAAARMGIRSILVRTGEAGRDRKYAVSPDFTVDDFVAAVDFILDGYPRLADAANRILKAVEPGDMLLIGGLAKVGKSTLAQVIASEYRIAGKAAAVISLDRWIRSLELRGQGVLERFDLDHAQNALMPWISGRDPVELKLPSYDPVTRRRRDVFEILRLEPDALLILEGVPALTMALPTERTVHRIYVESSEEHRRKRVIDDLIRRGRTEDEAAATYLERLHDESPTITHSRASAAEVFNLDPVLTDAEGPQT